MMQRWLRKALSTHRGRLGAVLTIGALGTGLYFFGARRTLHPEPESSIAHDPDRTEDPVDALVVGAGIAGLSAALEAANHGARVTVVDMWSVFGGHAMAANGLLNLVGTA